MVERGLEILVLLRRAYCWRRRPQPAAPHYVSPPSTSTKKPNPDLNVLFMVDRFLSKSHAPVRALSD